MYHLTVTLRQSGWRTRSGTGEDRKRPLISDAHECINEIPTVHI